jgi:hypothetical protein
MRDLIDEKSYRKVYISYYDVWVDLLVKRDYSSFPSESTTGWPSIKRQNNLTAHKQKDFITYKPIYQNGLLAGMSTTPEQFLEPSSFDRWLITTQAKNKAVAKFMDGAQQLGADFAERQKTIETIAKRARQAYDILLNIKKGRWERAVRILNGGRQPRSKKLASLQLEWVYGWAPFLGTIHDLCDREFPPNPEIYISEKVTKSVNMTQGNMKTEGTIRSGYSMLCVMDSPLVSSATKLGLVNPAAVAWELVPFSFIVDWFIPIGTYINSITAFGGFRIEDKCLSYSELLYMENIDRKNGGGRVRTKKTIERNVHVPPALRPLPKNPISAQHALNALSLIRVLRKDK